jgi:hypothetical protein
MEQFVNGAHLPEKEVLTSIKIPREMKHECKKRGIPYKRCFVVGFNKLVNGEADQTKVNNRQIEELQQDNQKMQRKLTELALKLYRLEKGDTEE